MEAAAKTVEDVRSIPVKDVLVPQNYSRKRGIDEATKELAESIKATGGVIQPIIVKEMGTGYEIVAGLRRLNATKLIGFADIRALVLPADTDQETLNLYTVTENLQREDLTPLEQANDIKKLILAGDDIKSIAAKLGKSVGWVARRAKLNDLTEGWRQEFNGELTEGWTVGHFELIARFGHDVQNSILKEIRGLHPWEARNFREFKHFEEFIADRMYLLKKAPWKLDDDTLLPKAGACIACPKRSSQNPELFDEEPTDEKIDKNDRCLDINCWARKAEKFLENKIEDKRKKYPDLVVLKKDYHGCRIKSINEIIENAEPEFYYETARKSDKGSVPAMVVDGDGLGRMRWVKRLGGEPSTVKEKADQDPEDPKTKLENRKRKHWGRRYSLILNTLRGRLDDSGYNSYDAQKTHKPLSMGESYPLPDSILKDDSGYLRLIALAAVFGTAFRVDYMSSGEWDNYEKLVNDTPQPRDVLLKLWQAVIPVLSSRLAHRNGDEAARAVEDAKKMCKVLEIDYEALEQEAVEQLPDPKSWAKLEREIAKMESEDKE